MQIRLRLFGELKEYAPEGAVRGAALLELPDGATVMDLINHLRIPYGGEEGLLVVAVNDVEAPHGQRLKPGDSVSMFEPLAGGATV